MGANIQEHDFRRQREAMVTEQIKRRGVKDPRVLEAMREVKRHLFVPLGHRFSAYADRPLPIDMEQTISQPYIVALMTELLNLRGDEKVLEIGTGSGYQTAILARLAKEVYTVELFDPLSVQAEKMITELGLRNIHLKTGDGFSGWLEQAPFDAIIVTCAPEEIPPFLIEQLAEGGRMVVPVGGDWQNLKLARKKNGEMEINDITAVKFVPMRKGGV